MSSNDFHNELCTRLFELEEKARTLLTGLQADGNNQEKLEELRRCFHSYSGDAKIMGHAKIGEHAASLEKLVQAAEARGAVIEGELAAITEGMKPFATLRSEIDC